MRLGSTECSTPGSSSNSAFKRPFLSPDGNRWIINAILNHAVDDKDVIIVGSGTSGGDAVVVAEEDQPTSFDGAFQWSFFLRRMGINNAGQYAFAGGTTAPGSSDDVVIGFNGTSQFVVAREGSTSPVLGLVHDSAHILNNGTVRYRSVLSPTTNNPQILASGTTVLVESDVTVPGNQLVPPAQTINLLSSERFTSSADGTGQIWHGSLNGPTSSDTVLVVNGNVVKQEGANLPGGVFPGFNVSFISGDAGCQQMSPNGSFWAARTAMNDGSDLREQFVELGRRGLLRDVLHECRQ